MLTNYLGGLNIAGGKLKATTLWSLPNTGATNESGFTAIPSGYRYDFGVDVFNSINYDCSWWSLSEYDINGAKVGFSDDTIDTLNHVEKYMKNELSLVYDTEFYVIDTSNPTLVGGIKKKI